MRKVTTHIRRPSAGTIIAVIALVMAMGGGGYAAVAKEKKGLAKFYAGHEFQPPDSTAQYARTGIGSLRCVGTPQLDPYFLPVDLPNGAKITKVTFFYSDNDADDDLSFALVSFFLGADGALTINDELGDASSSGASGTPESVAITPASPVAVYNANQDVELAMNFGECNDDFFFHGARVEYDLK